MLRAPSLALLLAVLSAAPVVAEPARSNDRIAAATEASSGTTTYFGDEQAKPKSPAAVAHKPKLKPLRPTVTAAVDLANQRMTVKVDGETRYSWPVSSGVAQYATPTGTFMPQRTEAMWYSRKYDMSPMPHAVFIHGGVAVHGTNHASSLGRPASHGCIRLSNAHAALFYNLVKRHGITRTRVTVYGKPNWRGDLEIAGRDGDDDRQSRYADSRGSWFWGDSWGGSDSAYDSGDTRRRPRQGYVDTDGRRVNTHRRRSADYGYRAAQHRGYYDYADD